MRFRCQRDTAVSVWLRTVIVLWHCKCQYCNFFHCEGIIKITSVCAGIQQKENDYTVQYSELSQSGRVGMYVWHCGNVWELPVTSAYLSQLWGHSVCSNNTLFMPFTCEKHWTRLPRLYIQYKGMCLCLACSAYTGNLPDIKCPGKTFKNLYSLIICVMTHFHPWNFKSSTCML